MNIAACIFNTIVRIVDVAVKVLETIGVLLVPPVYLAEEHIATPGVPILAHPVSPWNDVSSFCLVDIFVLSVCQSTLGTGPHHVVEPILELGAFFDLLGVFHVTGFDFVRWSIRAGMLIYQLTVAAALVVEIVLLQTHIE